MDGTNVCRQKGVRLQHHRVDHHHHHRPRAARLFRARAPLSGARGDGSGATSVAPYALTDEGLEAPLARSTTTVPVSATRRSKRMALLVLPSTRRKPTRSEPSAEPLATRSGRRASGKGVTQWRFRWHLSLHVHPLPSSARPVRERRPHVGGADACGVRKLVRRPDPPRLQRDRIYAPHTP